jgi:hypothetical protein
LSHSESTNTKSEQVSQIRHFVEKSTGLLSRSTDLDLEIRQRADGKSMTFSVSDLDEVISRVDSDGKSFLQVNFASGKKILLTDNLVGFKPMPSIGLDMSKLPRVVTTPDLLSVVEAIEESMGSANSQPEEVDVLKKVFDSVLRGGEAVGFDLVPERIWLHNIGKANRASA